MRTVELYDYLGDYWQLSLPCVYKKNRRGLTEMWVYVAKGPWYLARFYQKIPLPVFTEWWE